jgi:hypothetical protein
MRNPYNKLFVLLFLGLLIVQVLPPGQTISSGFSSFPIRDRLISFVTGLRLKAGDRVFHDVLIGKNQWLVYATDRGMDKYQDVNSLTNSELQSFDASLREFSAFVQKNGAKLYFVTAPYKNSIYPEFVPEEIQKIGNVSRYDQILNIASSQQSMQILDLRFALLEAKKSYQVYYSTDTHWNDLGGYFAYQTIINKMKIEFPALTPHPISDFNISMQPPKIMDLSFIIGDTRLAEQRVQLEFKFPHSAKTDTLVLPSGRQINISHNVNRDLPVALFLHDSFLYSLIPFLSEHFGTAYFVDLMAGNSMLPREWVEKIQPDVVVIVVNEHFLDILPQLLDKGRPDGE